MGQPVDCPEAQINSTRPIPITDGEEDVAADMGKRGHPELRVTISWCRGGRRVIRLLLRHLE